MARYLDRVLKLRQLRVVDAISNHGTLSSASRALGLSQPGVTKAIQELENIIGCRVFDRHPNGVHVTAAGQAITETARRVLAELSRLDDELDRLESKSLGSVAVGALPSVAVGLLPTTLARLRTRYPGLQIRLLQEPFETLSSALAAGEIDLFIGRLFEPAAPDGFVREALYEDRVEFMARASHPIFRQPITMEELVKYDLILSPVSHRFGQEVENLLANLPHFRPTLTRSSSIGFVREMIHASDSVTLAPRMLMAADILRGTIRSIPLDLGFPERPAGLVRHPDRPLRPSAVAFIEVLKETIPEIIGSTPPHDPIGASSNSATG